MGKSARSGHSRFPWLCRLRNLVKQHDTHIFEVLTDQLGRPQVGTRGAGARGGGGKSARRARCVAGGAEEGKGGTGGAKVATGAGRSRKKQVARAPRSRRVFLPFARLASDGRALEMTRMRSLARLPARSACGSAALRVLISRRGGKARWLPQLRTRARARRGLNPKP